jgi:hypothetical protein
MASALRASAGGLVLAKAQTENTDHRLKPGTKAGVDCEK